VLILGIDEAGRGPVIGPLVMVGFLIDESQEPELKELGVRDSKKLCERRREELEPQLREMGQVFMEVIRPWQIDAENLNLLERKAAKKLILKSKPNKAIVDAFERNLSVKLATPGVSIVAEHKADDTYPVVSAASIVAKVHRDGVIRALTEEFGPMGSGYPSDPDTRVFVETWLRDKKTFPDFLRRSWGTTRDILDLIQQKRLGDF